MASDLGLYRAQCQQRTPWLDSIFCGIWSGSILCSVPTENTLIGHHILWHLIWVYTMLSADREHPDRTPCSVEFDLGLYSVQCRQRTPWLDTIFCGIWSGSILCSVPTENTLISANDKGADQPEHPKVSAGPLLFMTLINCVEWVVKQHIKKQITLKFQQHLPVDILWQDMWTLVCSTLDCYLE